MKPGLSLPPLPPPPAPPWLAHTSAHGPSAGYDAHWRDPLEHLQFQSGTFHWLGGAVLALARELCDGRLLLLLEGG